MEFTEIRHNLANAALFESVWFLSSGDEPAPVDAGLVTPDGCVELVFALGDGAVEVPATLGGGEVQASGGLVFGMATRAHRLVYPGRARLVGMRLRPAAALGLFGPDLPLLRDAVVSLVDARPQLAREIAGVLEASLDRGRSEDVAGALVATVSRLCRAENGRLALAMQSILGRTGRVRLSELASEVGMSSRHLGRCFERRVGVCPKLLCRIARFRAAWQLGHVAQACNWARVAARCGYADQAHLCREFRVFSGQTPGDVSARWAA